MWVDIEYENLGINMLAVIQTEMLTEPIAKKQGIVMANSDLKATKLVTGYDWVGSLRVRNVRTMWGPSLLYLIEVCLFPGNKGSGLQ